MKRLNECREWLDFKTKIIYLYENMFNGDMDILIENFSLLPIHSPQEKASRKRVISKWLNGEVKSPYIDTETFKISTYTFYKEQLLPQVAFKEWSFHKFKKHVDLYLEDKLKFNLVLEDYKYIYYFSRYTNTLQYSLVDYFEDNRISISIQGYPQSLIFTGKIERLNSMMHFIVSNEDSTLFFSFNISSLKLDYYLLGMSLSKNLNSSQPKSSFVLLSSEQLTKEQEDFFLTKLNVSNILQSDNSIMSKDMSFLSNFDSHVRSLYLSSIDYKSDDVLLNLFLEKFNLFYSQFNDFLKRDELQVSSFSSIFSYVLFYLSKKYSEIKILCAIDTAQSIFIPESSDEIKNYNLLIFLVKEKKVQFEFIILFDKDAMINHIVRDKFIELQSLGVTLLFSNHLDNLSYSTLFLVDSNDFALSALKEVSHYSLTSNKKIINHLNSVYNGQCKRIMPLDDIIFNKLEKSWYLYGYGTNNTLIEGDLILDGNDVSIEILNNKKTFYGKYYDTFDNRVFITTLGIFSFHEFNINSIINVVSFISGQKNSGDIGPVILYAVISSCKIDRYDLELLFSSFVNQFDSPYENASFKFTLDYRLLKKLRDKYDPNLNLKCNF